MNFLTPYRLVYYQRAQNVGTWRFLSRHQNDDTWEHTSIASRHNDYATARHVLPTLHVNHTIPLF